MTKQIDKRIGGKHSIQIDNPVENEKIIKEIKERDKKSGLRPHFNQKR